MPDITVRAVPVRVNLYNIIADAVESGVNRGYAHAHKHTDHPGEEQLKEEIVRGVLGNICEAVNFDDEREEKLDVEALALTLRECIVELNETIASFDEGDDDGAR